MPGTPARGSLLRGTFEALDPSRPLDDDVLTAIVFGSRTPCPADPRCVRIDLEPLAGEFLSEVWRGRGASRLGTAGPIRYVENGDVFAGWMSIDEVASADCLKRRKPPTLRFCGSMPNHHTGTSGASGTSSPRSTRGKATTSATSSSASAVRALSPPRRIAGRRPRSRRLPPSARGGPHSLQVCWIAGREPDSPLRTRARSAPMTIRDSTVRRHRASRAPWWSRVRCS